MILEYFIQLFMFHYFVLRYFTSSSGMYHFLLANRMFFTVGNLDYMIHVVYTLWDIDVSKLVDIHLINIHDIVYPLLLGHHWIMRL